MENNKEEIIEKTKKGRIKKDTTVLAEKKSQGTKSATKKKSTTTNKTTKKVTSGKKTSVKKSTSASTVKTTKNSTKPKQIKTNKSLEKTKKDTEISKSEETTEPLALIEEPNIKLKNFEDNAEENSEDVSDTQEISDAENVKEKRKKVKKTKKELSKASQKKLALLGIIVSALALVGLIAGVFVWWVNVNKPMQTPTISITSLENKTYIFAEFNPNAVGYEFFFKEKGDDKENIIYSDSNMIEVAKYLNKPSVFELKVRTIGEIAGANSAWSEVLTYTYNMRLSSPEISKIQNGENTVITFRPIEYAQSYKLYYKKNNGDWKTLTIGQGASSQNIVVNFTNLANIDAGSYQIYVVALPDANNQFVTESYTSNVVSVAKFSTLENCVIEQNTKLTYTIKYNKDLIENVKNFNISINNCKFIINSDILLKKGTNLGEFICYTFDISSIYNELTNGTPSICKAKVISSNIFMYDSQEAEFTLN